MKYDIMDLSNKVNDEKSFIEFINALSADCADEVEKEKINPSPPFGPGANGWENGTIENFLEAAAAWASQSINGTELYKKPENPWTRCAQILSMGKYYE